jgi:FemAB-related protein (PEP-CTERM system-associated)
MQPARHDLHLPARPRRRIAARFAPAASPAASLYAGLRGAPSRGIRIAPLEAASEFAWADFVARRQDATFFHELPWKRAVQSAFGHEPHYLIACRGSAAVGVLPMFLIKSVLAGRILISLPYATYGGALADDDEARATLLNEARRRCRVLGARLLELRSITAGDPTLPARRSHAMFQKSLPSNVGDVADMLPRKARAAARRALEKHALTVDFGTNLVEEVWRLYARSMRRLASPNYPLRFFRAILDAAGPKGAVAQLVRCGSVPVAGLLTFLHRRTVMPYFVGVDERRDIYGLSQFLYARSMQWGVQNGYERYDFGRTRFDNPGPFEFKRLCGFEPRALEYQDYTPPGRQAPDLSPTSPRWALARRIWRRLPLPITRPLGAAVARSITG